MRRSVMLWLCIIAIGVAAEAADRPEGRMDATRSVVYAKNGMVAAAHPVAVQIGVDILKRGGSAVDAAIAVNAALTFMEPTSCGLGGDLFAMVWDPANQKLAGLNASGRAPAGLTRDKVPAAADGTIPEFTPYTWTVPGCVDGWFELHGRYGRLPMAEVLAPAIAAASAGVPVPQVIAGSWERAVPYYENLPGFSEVFLPGGVAPKEGEIFANPALANTLRLIAENGRDVFYTGKSPNVWWPIPTSTVGSFLSTTFPAIQAIGSNPSRPPTVGSRSGSCRPTARVCCTADAEHSGDLRSCVAGKG